MNRRNSQLGRMVRVLVAGIGLGSAAVAQQTPANGEIGVAGTVAGSYLQTWSGDGVYEAIQEVESGGKPSKRTSLLEHKWTFDVPAGTSVSLHVRAHHDANAEGDDFVFAWSTDEVAYADLLTVTKTIDDGTYQTADLDPSVSGLIYVRARDTDRSQSHRELDALYVDHLYIQSSQVPTPPAAPSDLEAGIAEAAGYDGLLLEWTDNSGNEDGFRIERSLDGISWNPLAMVGPDVTSHVDTGLLPEATYSYVVQAFNGQGDSGWSNVATGTTLPPLAFTSEVVEPAGAFYYGLAYDPLGRPAIGYVSDDVLWFAQWNGVGWDIEPVDATQTGVGIAFLPDGRPCLSYGWGEVRFAEKIGESWSIEVVEPGNNNDWHSLVIAPDGNPSIAYTDTGSRIDKVKIPGGLRLATRIAGSWLIQVVDPAQRPAHRSLAYDSFGRPSIAYNGWDGDRYFLKFAHWNGAAWSLEVVETESTKDCGLFPRLAYDPISGWPAIAHYMRGMYPSGGPETYEVRVVRWNGAAWQAETVAHRAAHCGGLGFTPLGAPYVGYTRFAPAEDGGGLWVAHEEGSSWVHELVLTFSVPKGRLVLDPSQRPSLAWSGNEGLHFAHQ